MTRTLPALGAFFLLLGLSDAQATIIQTFTSKAAFLAQVTVANGNIITFGPSGPGPVIDLTGTAANATGGLLEIEATPGVLFGASTVLSTDTALATLVFNFAQPLRAVGLSGFISDEFFAAVAGSLSLTATGSGGISIPVTTSGAVFRGIVSDVDFSSLTLTIDTFDLIATSAPFVTVTDAAYLDPAPAVLPAPGIVVFLGPLLILLCHKLRASFRRWQHGQRGTIATRTRAMRPWTVVMEVLTWRSGRNGAALGR